MTQFTTKVKLPNYPTLIAPNHKMLTIGSCFSENIGSRLETSRFGVYNNTFGTLYNPVSISNVICRSLTSQEVEAQEIAKNGEVYFHYDFHSKYNSTSPEKTLKPIQADMRRVKRGARSIDWLIITLGTSIAYRLLENDSIVANCHKMSNKLFRKELLSLGHMKESLLMAIEEFIHANPSVQVILTVSPVRHIKDGLMENSRSKARLLELATQLAEHLDYVHYFPAYEIMQDELRDYRYYDRDLIHPSPLAIDIIWQAFVKSLMSSDAQEMVKTTTAIYKDINHRPIVAGTEQHKSFVKNLLKKIERAEKRYPHIKYTKEVRVLKKIL